MNYSHGEREDPVSELGNGRAYFTKPSKRIKLDNSLSPSRWLAEEERKRGNV